MNSYLRRDRRKKNKLITTEEFDASCREIMDKAMKDLTPEQIKQGYAELNGLASQGKE